MWRNLFLLLLFFFSSSIYAKTTSNFGYEQCNWLVNYRNHTYDLTPLTRTGLNRPIESDLRPVLERVPRAAEKLQLVTDLSKEAKAHSIIGSAAITIFIGNRLINYTARRAKDDSRLEMDVISLVSGLIFFKATYDSWRATSASKEELAEAIDIFNEKSPYKITPANKGAE